MTYETTTEDRYWYMLEVLPPASQTKWGFLVGEPVNHRKCTVLHRIMPTYDAFFEVNGKYYASKAPMTPTEFRDFCPEHLEHSQ
jgi:hypothetical protein